MGVIDEDAEYEEVVAARAPRPKAATAEQVVQEATRPKPENLKSQAIGYALGLTALGVAFCIFQFANTKPAPTQVVMGSDVLVGREHLQNAILNGVVLRVKASHTGGMTIKLMDEQGSQFNCYVPPEALPQGRFRIGSRVQVMASSLGGETVAASEVKIMSNRPIQKTVYNVAVRNGIAQWQDGPWVDRMRCKLEDGWYERLYIVLSDQGKELVP